VATVPPAVTTRALLDELRQWLGREVRGARTEVDRCRALLGEAIGQLNTSFRSMEEQSRLQRATVTRLIDEDGHGSPGVRQFAEAAGALITELAQLLADDSRESVRTVQIIDEMVGHLNGLFGLLQRLEGANAADLAMKSTFAVGQVRSRVEETAEREMNASIEARTKADSLLHRLGAIDRSLAAGIRTVSDSGERIRDDVANAVRSLQFEDVVMQSLTAAGAHLDRLLAINQDAIRLQTLLADFSTPPEMRQRALEAYAESMQRTRATWEGALRKPVSQSSMRAGEVELF
jgi:methyl-accepting chemotaxis protein